VSLKFFNICLVKPDNYVHSYAFVELGELLLHSLRELGHDATLKIMELADDRINILIGCHLLNPTEKNEVPKSTIILNTEQIHSDDAPWNSNIFEWVRHFEAWDYSAKNIEKFKSLGITNVKHLQIGYQSELKRIKKAAVQDIDVLFYGSVNERRNKILEALKSQGLKVGALFGVYGSDRDSFIARSKIVLNHHFYKSQIFEVVRVFYLLHNEVAVVAEINETTHIEDRWKEAISGAPYDRLVDRVLDLLGDPPSRKAVEENGLEQIMKFPQHIYTAQVLAD
jgi:hypothetical protein